MCQMLLESRRCFVVLPQYLKGIVEFRKAQKYKKNGCRIVDSREI